jgi:hypothetical protein
LPYAIVKARSKAVLARGGVLNRPARERVPTAKARPDNLRVVGIITFFFDEVYLQFRAFAQHQK